jgi:hypothetical protein
VSAVIRSKDADRSTLWSEKPVAEGELLNITTVKNERHTLTYRLKDLEERLDPERFIRLGRGTLVNVDLLTKFTAMPGGTHVAVLSNGQKLPVSRLQSRVFAAETAQTLIRWPSRSHLNAPRSCLSRRTGSMLAVTGCGSTASDFPVSFGNRTTFPNVERGGARERGPIAIFR